YPVLDVALRAAEPLVQRLGWTLVHSLWQGVLVAAVLAVVLRLLLRGAPANVRYAAACAAMSMMAFAAVFTFTRIRVDVNVTDSARQDPPSVVGEPRFIAPMAGASAPIVVAPAPLAPSPRDEHEAILRIVVLA